MSKKNSLVELLKNVSFLKWLKKEEEIDNADWDKWQQESQENAQLAADAKMLKKGIPFKKQTVNQTKMQANWNELASRLDHSSPKLVVVQQTNAKSSRRNWLKIAAAIACLITSFWGIHAYLNQGTLVHYQTDFAKQEMIQLPDGTEVILAANSSLSFYDNLEKKDKRSVQLLGEAFFKVAPQPQGKQFIVELKDLSVTVVGTEFNINSHRKNAIISLLEGKVTLNKIGIAKQQLVAGQTAMFNNETSTFDLLNNQTNYWADWRFQRWSFGEGISMKEVIQRIEETFGLTVKVEDTTILTKKASGSIAIDNQTELFESLSYLLNVDFYLNGDTLLISQKMENQE